MNVLLWVLQGLAAILFGASGVMKVFMFTKISGDVPSFGALPRPVWTALGVLELVCVTGLIAPAVFGGHPEIAGVAAAVLALEAVLFVWVHVRYHETAAIILNTGLGFVMAFVTYGRLIAAWTRQATH